MLNPFLYLLREVIPLGIYRFYQFEFLFSISSFELFFSHNCRFDIFKIFIIHTEFTIIFFCETFYDSFFVFRYSSEKITGNSYIDRSISLTCHNVDISRFHSGIFYLLDCFILRNDGDIFVNPSTVVLMRM